MEVLLMEEKDADIRKMVDFWGNAAEALLNNKKVDDSDEKAYKHALAATSSICTRLRLPYTARVETVIVTVLSSLWDICKKHTVTDAITAGTVKVIVESLTDADLAVLVCKAEASTEQH
jgi:hypothetical protein